MTISESLTAWLQTYGEEYRNIYTEYLRSDAVSMGIYKQPARNIQEDILGRRTFTDHYMMLFRFDASTNTERVSNQAALEALEKWIREQNDDHNFPVLTDAECKEVAVSSPFYLETASDAGTYVYQMSLSITYKE